MVTPTHLRMLLAEWPERCSVYVRLRLYDDDRFHRVTLPKLQRVFELAELFRIFARISTNLDRFSPVSITLDGYVLRQEYAGGGCDNWGRQKLFLERLAKEFPGDVCIDPPKEAHDNFRYKIDSCGNITEIIETWEEV